VGDGGVCGVVKLHDVVTGKEVKSLDLDRLSDCRAVAFAPNGKQFVVSGANGVQVWDASTFEQQWAWRYDNKPERTLFLSAKWSWDGRLIVATGEVRFVVVLDAASGKELRRIEAPAAENTGLCFSPDGKTIAASCIGDSLLTWDVDSGKKVLEMEAGVRQTGQGRTSAPVVFSPDGKYLAAWERQGRLSMWDLETGSFFRTQAPMTEPAESYAIVFMKDGKHCLVGDETGNVHVVTWPNLKTIGTWRAHRLVVSGLSVSPDGKLVASCGWDRKLKLWKTSEILAIGGP
jgi:WD40 repeat protein